MIANSKGGQAVGAILKLVRQIPAPTEAVTDIGDAAKAYMDYVTAWQLFWMHFWGVK